MFFLDVNDLEQASSTKELDLQDVIDLRELKFRGNKIIWWNWVFY